MRCINQSPWPIILLVFPGQLLYGYAITAVAWLYWSRHVSSLFEQKKKNGGSDAQSENTGASLKRLMAYMLPYTCRFVFVMLLVTLSSYGMYICERAFVAMVCDVRF